MLLCIDLSNFSKAEPKKTYIFLGNANDIWEFCFLSILKIQDQDFKIDTSSYQDFQDL